MVNRNYEDYEMVRNDVYNNYAYAVLNVEFEPEPRASNGGCIGIDVGIKEFYSDSSGTVVPNPKHLEKSMRKLIRELKKTERV